MSGDELTVSELGANPSTTDRAPAGPGGRSAPLSVDQILDGLAEGFFALDSNWRFIAFNRAAEAMFEIAREQVLGKLLWEVSPGILGTEFDRRYRLAMSSRQEQQFESYTIRRPDRFHEVRAFPLGEGIGVAFKDATDRRNILETLRRRELELARVQEIGGVGGMRVDLAGGFTGHRSPEYLRLHGLSAGRRRRKPRGLGAPHPSRRPVAGGRAFSARRRGRRDPLQVGIPDHSPGQRRGALDPRCRRNRTR